MMSRLLSQTMSGFPPHMLLGNLTMSNPALSTDPMTGSADLAWPPHLPLTLRPSSWWPPAHRQQLHRAGKSTKLTFQLKIGSKNCFHYKIAETFISKVSAQFDHKTGSFLVCDSFEPIIA